MDVAMTMIRRVTPISVSQLADDEVEATFSTGDLARDKHILVPGGAKLANFQRNPIILWQHQAEEPVARAEDVRVEGDKIIARVRFAPTGVSPTADRVRGLVKAGIVNCMSVGFEPLDGTPIDPNRPRGGQRFSSWELLEVSFCSVPVDPGAVVTARAEIDSPNNVREREIMDKEAEAGERAVSRKRNRTRKRVHVVPKFERGLYDVAHLAYVLQEIGCIADCAAYERDLEGDGSKVPEMLGEALMQLGEALIAMTTEEVGELMADRGGEDEADLSVEERDLAPRVRTWRRSLADAVLRSGRVLSDETIRFMDRALDAHEEGLDHSRAAIRAHKRGVLEIRDLLERVTPDVPDEQEDADQAAADKAAADQLAADKADRSLPLDYRRRQVEALALATTH
jgi:HK97 family phage prohead protease